MAEPVSKVPSRQAALSQALRRLRRLRDYSPGEMAEAMNMQRRTYEYFEAGRGKINVDRIHQFAKVLNVDPFAILAAVEIRSPGFAVACAEHKLMTVYMVTLQEFDANAGDATSRLTAATIVSSFTRVFDALAREATDGRDFVETWMSDTPPPDGGAGEAAGGAPQQGPEPSPDDRPDAKPDDED